MARSDWKKTRDGREYQDWRYSVEELHEDVHRFRMTPEQARKSLMDTRRLFDRLLDPKTSDAKRCAIVNTLKRRLVLGFSTIETLAALSKIANGHVDPKTLQYRDG